MSIAQFSLLPRLRARPRTGWIGIDIGSHSIKLAQLELVQGQKQIVESAVIPIPESAELTAESIKSGWLAQTLRHQLLQHRGFRGRNAACVLSMSVTEFRALNIPPGSPKERREMIAQELAESGNSLSENSDFDFWEGYTGPAEAANGEATVNVLSIPNGLATHVAKAVQSAGLNCQILDGGPFVMARSLELVNRRSTHEQPIAILDWGNKTAHFVIISGGQPVFSRVLKDCGVGALVTAVGRGLSLDPEDCHQLLSTCGVPNPHLDHAERTELQEMVIDFAGEMLHQVAVELDKTLSYLGSQRAELLPEELWLIGGGATIQNIDQWISFETGVAATRWRPEQRSSASHFQEGKSVEVLAQAAALSELGWTA
jgi:Tfp pilus assembly PilM family ATPase